MKEQIPELLVIMRDEIRFYHNLLECEQRKTTLLAEGRIEELTKCNKTEEESVTQLHALEAKRLRICVELCEELKIPREEFTLLRLAQSLNGSPELNDCAALLRSVVKRVQAVVARNRDLIEKPLRYAEGMLTVFANAAGSYQPNGTFNAEASVYPTFSKNA